VFLLQSETPEQQTLFYST